MTAYFPEPPQCVANGGGWCTKTATVWLLAPGEVRVPGSFYCVEHGARLVAEYRRKLDETWTLEPIEQGQPPDDEVPISRGSPATFGWLRRPEHDHDGAEAWENPTGELQLFEPGKRPTLFRRGG